MIDMNKHTNLFCHNIIGLYVILSKDVTYQSGAHNDTHTLPYYHKFDREKTLG
jgi:hypothetical protein